jgi:hypothetical protein
MHCLYFAHDQPHLDIAFGTGSRGDLEGFAVEATYFKHLGSSPINGATIALPAGHLELVGFLELAASSRRKHKMANKILQKY